MSDVRIRLRPNGPLLVEGPITIVDQNGNPFPLNPEKTSVALCRCGHTQNSPFCDGSHKTSGYVCERLAPSPPTP
jgi:CDGSH-type Zn-finger protein